MLAVGPFAAAVPFMGDPEEMHNPADTALGSHRYCVMPFVTHGIHLFFQWFYR